MNRFIIYACIFFAAATLNVASAQSDSSKLDFGIYKIDELFDNYDSTAYDSSMNYFEIIPYYRNNSPLIINTGNYGLAARSLLIDNITDIRNRFYRNDYNFYFYDESDVNYYNPPVPYTEWYYLIGAHREQLFQVKHGQNIGRGMKFGADLKIINSSGSYQHQHAKDASFLTYLDYKSEDGHYSASFKYIFNRMFLEENGGIASLNAYLDSTEQYDRELAIVNLYGAENALKNNKLSLYQKYNFLSSKNDSLGKSDAEISVNLGLTYFKEWMLYTDWDPFAPFYTITVDSLETYDSISRSSFAADAFVILSTKKEYIKLRAGLEAVLHNTYDIYGERKDYDWSPYALMKLNFTEKMNLMVKARLLRTMRNKTAFAGSAQINLGLFKAGADIVSSMPYQMDEAYSSNHFFWVQDFDNQTATKLYAEIEKSGFTLRSNLQTTSNYIYFDDKVIPQQYGKALNLLQSSLTYKREWGKMISLSGVYWNENLSDTNLLRIPQFVAHTKFAYRFKMFKGKLNIMAGLDAMCYTSYMPYAWMPVTRVFHLQNSYSTGFDYKIDPFINFAIREVRLMLKYEHANAWLTGYNLMPIPYYPFNDPAIKFAVAWRFMN